MSVAVRFPNRMLLHLLVALAAAALLWGSIAPTVRGASASAPSQ
jgi:hypothetical protein